MSALRTITCPTCGKRHYIGSSCRGANDAKPEPRLARFTIVLIVILLTALVITAISLAAADARGKGLGLAIAFGMYLLMNLVRLGYEWDDGIDLSTLVLPAPFDWGVKWERFIHFWTAPRPWFRAIYLGSALAMIIVAIVLIAQGKP